MSRSQNKGKTPTANILLSTFNGEKYVGELLDSLINQDYPSFKILVRDDGSSDSTLSILESYKQRFPTLVEIIDFEPNVNLGVKKSFEALMRSAHADYYLFCDQDDIWDVSKTSVLVDLVNQEEIQQERNGCEDLPLLGFSDFRIFDEERIMVASYYREINLQASDVKNKLFSCVMPGCCFCFNQKAKELYFEYETEYLHDGHLFLLFQLYGKVLLTQKCLLSYRVHENNVVGFWKRTKNIILIKDFFKYLINKNVYRRIILGAYDSQLRLLYKQMDNNFLRKNEFYLLDEVDTLPFLSRKRWYINHFKPCKKGVFQGIMEILTF